MYVFSMFAQRVRPVYHRLFDRAVYITGDYASAQEAVNEAVKGEFRARRKRTQRAFYSSLARRTDACALRRIPEEGSGITIYESSLASIDERPARALVLMSMGYSLKRAAKIAGASPSDVLFESRRMSRQRLRSACRSALGETRGVPNAESALRALREDISSRSGQKGAVSFVYAIVLAALMLIFCALVFIAASISAPTRLEGAPAEPQEQTFEFPDA